MNLLGKELMFIGVLVIFLRLWQLTPISLTRQDVRIIGLFAMLSIAHVFIFGSMVMYASLGFIVKLGIALLAVRLIPDFSRRYVFLMYLLSLTSFIFWVPYFLGMDMRSLLSSIQLPLRKNSDFFNIGIHHFYEEFDGAIRNMGMFWEPGAFAGYLVLALFLLIRDEQNFSLSSRRAPVLIAALLSTQSTTGYITFIVLVVFSGYNSNWIKNSSAKYVLLPATLIIIITSAYFIFNKVDFLGEKIIGQFEETAMGTDASRISRFGNFLYDMESFVERPLIGWGANPETRSSFDEEVLDLVAGQGNGLTGFAVRYGLTGLLVFLGFFAYNTKRISGSAQIMLCGLVVVCLLLNGEQFLNYPMFFTLMFLPQIAPKRLTNNPTTNVRSLIVDEYTGSSP